MRHLAAVLVLALVTPLAACGNGSSGAAGQELVANGGFETGLSGADGWDVSGGAHDQMAAVVYDSGNRVLSMTGSVVADVTWPQAISPEFPVEAGSRYELGLRARSDSFGLVTAIVWFTDADGTDLTGIGPGTWEVGTTDWTTFDFAFDVPDGAIAAHVILRLALNTDMTTEARLTVDVDDVSVRRLG